MAIAYDNATFSQNVTFSHTTAGTDRILFVQAQWNTVDGTLTGITYGGVAMTLLAEQAVGTGTQTTSLYYLVNPAVGANNVVRSGTGSIPTDGYADENAVSYTGAAQTGVPDSFAKDSVAGVSSFSVSTTVVASDCWLVATVRDTAGVVTNNGGATEQTRGSNAYYWDSDGTVGTGSQTAAFAGGNGNWAIVVASFAPAGATPPSTGASVNHFLLMGV